jgi:hypothetical protein
LNNYILALETAGESAAQTIAFDEESNSFDGFLSLFPEYMVTMGDLLVAFKNGDLYTHDSEEYNTFFGTTYDSYIKPVFNKSPLQKKSWISVTEVASEIWDCPEIVTNVNSYGAVAQQSNLVEADFVTREGNFHATFLRDTNSIGGLIEGDSLKGQYLVAKFRCQSPTNLVNLAVVSIYYLPSQLINQ